MKKLLALILAALLTLALAAPALAADKKPAEPSAQQQLFMTNRLIQFRTAEVKAGQKQLLEMKRSLAAVLWEIELLKAKRDALSRQIKESKSASADLPGGEF